ncbi:MAG: hypothetical protein ACXV3F_08095 [Frankiaceae bacterium]
MTDRNRWQGPLVMACASCCWLSPLPPDWLARVYGLDASGDVVGDSTGAALSPADSGQSRARAGRRWGPRRTTPATADL